MKIQTLIALIPIIFFFLLISSLIVVAFTERQAEKGNMPCWYYHITNRDNVGNSIFSMNTTQVQNRITKCHLFEK